MSKLNKSVSEVVKAGGLLAVVSDEEGGFVAVVSDGESVTQRVEAKTIEGALTAIGAGVVPRRPLFAPGQKGVC